MTVDDPEVPMSKREFQLAALLEYALGTCDHDLMREVAMLVEDQAELDEAINELMSSIVDSDEDDEDVDLNDEDL